MSNSRQADHISSGDGRTGIKAVRNLISSGAVGLIGFVLLGFCGFYFAPGDAAAVIRPQAGAVLLSLAALLWFMNARRIAMASLATAVLAIGSVAPGFLASGSECTGNCLTLYQKNLLSKAWPRYSLADDIVGSGAEIVTLQEVSEHNQRFMGGMYDHYPSTLFCQFRPEQKVAILTSLPVVQGSEFCLTGGGLAGIQVMTPDARPIWVLSVHLYWPFPFDQFRQARMIADKIDELDGPVLIAGDFNMLPWGGSVQRIRQAAGNRHFGAFRNTYKLGNQVLPLAIDYVLVPEGTTGTVELRPNLGSDHLGVLAHFALP